MRRVVLSILLVLALTALAVLWPSGAASAQQPVLALDAQVGFDGYVQSGTWTPVFVTVRNDGPDITAELRVEVTPLTGGPTIYTRSLDLPRGSRKRVTLYAADLYPLNGQVRIDLLQNGRVVASTQSPVQMVSPTTLLIGIWSDTPTGLAALSAVKPSSGETRVAMLTADELPSVGEGWWALDVLVISDADTGQLDVDQQAALFEWVAGGGRLIITGGLSYPRTLSGLDQLTPLLAVDTQAVSLQPLSQVAGVPFDVQAALTAPVAVGSLIPEAHVLVHSGDVPLVVWRTVGHGRVDFLAADPNLEPLRSWNGMGDLWTTLLILGRPRPAWAYGFTSQWDTALQAVASVPGVSLPSAIQLCGFLALYIVLIGPLNYLVLTRLKRRELAWFTIPILIVLFTAVAYVTGFQLRGSRAILHRLALVQSWSNSDVSRVDALLGVWSPRRARYDLLIDQGYLVRPIPRNLSGALSGGVGGQVVLGQTTTLRGVQVDVASVQPFAIEGYSHTASRITGDLMLSLQGESLHIAGEVVNAGDVDLTGVVLAMAGTTWPLGDLRAGQVLQVDQVFQGGLSTFGAASALDPYPATGGYGYYGYDQFLSSIVGGDCFSTADIRRRCDLVGSLLNGQGRGSGAYLFGWADEVPIGIQVLNVGADPVDVALYVIEMNVSLPSSSQGTIVVPPSLMTYYPLDEEYYYATPYGLYMYAGEEYAFRFVPATILPPLSVDSFIIHMESDPSYGEQSGAPVVEAHNFATGQWDMLPVEWGDTVISQAQPYVDPAGGIELRLRVPMSDTESWYQVMSFEVSLLGQVGSPR